MSRVTTVCCAGLTLALIAGSARALDIGDPAPPVQVSTWVKNGPVDVAAGKGKNIYVIEFWATWCQPCLISIPHLTELQKKYRDKGVVVIGLSDEPLAVVKPFVEKMGDKMDYAVGIDKRETTGRNYMAPFGIDGIPYAFVIEKGGALIWHGHPLEGLDELLERMVAGTYDVQQARREAAAARLLEEYLQAVEKWNRTTDDRERTRIGAQARQLGEKIVEQASRSPGLLNEFASIIVLMPETEYRDLDLAARAAEAAYQAGEKTDSDKAHKLMLDYFRALRAAKTKQPPATQPAPNPQSIAAQILEHAGPRELTGFAWTIMAAPGLEPRDLPLALKAADAARTATSEQDATVLDTYARALFENGQREKALEYSRKAVQVNKDEALAPILKQSFDEYEKALAEQAGK